MSKGRHLGRKLIAVDMVVILTLAHHPLMGGEPTVSIDFSTFYGTQGSTFNTTRAVDVDSEGNIVFLVEGNVDPDGFPGVPVHTYGPVNPRNCGGVAKLSADGSRLLWVSLIGGSGKGDGFEKCTYGLELDAQGNIYVTGCTHNADFPTTEGAYDETPNQMTKKNGEVYVVKFSPDGALVYSTFLGGSAGETPRGGVAVDREGYAYITGTTASADFLSRPSSQRQVNVINRFVGPRPAVVVKLAPDGSKVIWARFLGVEGSSCWCVGKGVRVDESGNVYVACNIKTPGAHTTDGSDYKGVGQDLYMVKLSPDGRTIRYATYFGGSQGEGVSLRFWLDPAGCAYLAGWTMSKDVPLIDAPQTMFTPGPRWGADGLLVKFDPTGKPVFSRYLETGGAAFGPAVDANGNVFVAGICNNRRMKVTANALDATHNGGNDGFLQVYSPKNKLVYSTFIGGKADDFMHTAMESDTRGNVILTPETRSPDFPATKGVWDTKFCGNFDCAIMKLGVSFSVPLEQAR